MTCIVGLVDNGKVWMGADSLGANSWFDQTLRRDRKIFRNDEFLMGFTSSFRMGQLLQYRLHLPKRYPDTDIMKYMVAEFVESVRQCLKEGGYTNVKENEERGGHFLVGYQGHLFQIESDFQVQEALDGIDACGCGGSYALGSLYVSQGAPEERIRKALETAEHFSAGVKAPFIIECLEAKT